MTPLIGVRISWLMLARNSLFCAITLERSGGEAGLSAARAGASRRFTSSPPVLERPVRKTTCRPRRPMKVIAAAAAPSASATSHALASNAIPSRTASRLVGWRWGAFGWFAIDERAPRGTRGALDHRARTAINLCPHGRLAAWEGFSGRRSEHRQLPEPRSGRVRRRRRGRELAREHAAEVLHQQHLAQQVGGRELDVVRQARHHVGRETAGVEAAEGREVG